MFEKLKNGKLPKTLFVVEFLTLDLKVTLFRSTYGDLVMTSHRYYTEKSLSINDSLSNYQ